MGQGELWQAGRDDKEIHAARVSAMAPARCIPADRSQICLRPLDLDQLIGEDHPARVLWEAVSRLDLSRLYEPIKARENTPGRAPTDPKVLLALWLYATSQGVGAARQVERLTREHRGYRWLRGEVPLNHHMLSDFRTHRAAEIDALLTQLLGVLMHQGLIPLVRVAQDGLRIRASAGSSSFRRRKKLKECLELARQQVHALREEQPEQAAARSARHRAAQQRAATEREQRLSQALAELAKVEARREQTKKAGGWRPKSEPRASTSDPEARHMRMPDGGYSPAYNVQLATETKSNFIVGVAVTNDGTDYAHAVPMIEQIERRTGQRPQECLVDAGYSSQQTVDGIDALGVTLYAGLQKHGGKEPTDARASDSAAVAALRQRMASDAGKEIFKERASTSERVNGDLRTRRTLDRMLVRGMNKVLSVAVLNVLAYDLLRWIRIGIGS